VTGIAFTRGTNDSILLRDYLRVRVLASDIHDGPCGSQKATRNKLSPEIKDKVRKNLKHVVEIRLVIRLMQGFGMRRRGAGRSRNGALGAPTIWPASSPTHTLTLHRIYVFMSQVSSVTGFFISFKRSRGELLPTIEQ